MARESTADQPRTEERDYYEVLGAEPSASTEELRVAFREAVLRHHPDRHAGEMATRRTSVLNRAWNELRDPVRRLHYDRALERGNAPTLPWPLEPHEQPMRPRRRPRVAGVPEQPSPWHQPQWRSVAGFRVPAEVFMAGPAAQRRWIVENRIAGEDWREHTELYWLRFAADHYRDRGRVDDWVGALERLVSLDLSFDTLVRADLRAAYVATEMFLRGIGFLSEVAERYPPGSFQRRWVERELRALLAEFRDRRVRRGRPEERAEAAELLLNYLEALGIEPTFSDVRAAIAAHRRAGHHGRAAELVERAVAAPVVEPARWFGLVQLLTEAGQLDRASILLAEIARGEHPDALDRRLIGGDPARRISAARARLARARARARAASGGDASIRPRGAERLTGVSP
ncbi:MAG TPA: J domain-containing protein [candidate division Zixibacteria bacterium]|nr:J domain-containing protein [candidate division Zixibacteria bacterium]